MPAQPCYRFSLAEIQYATRDFDDEMVIGGGGFGKVYGCCICIEKTIHAVAIKRLDCMSNQGATEFKVEIEMLSKLRHCHLVSLIGLGEDNKEMILVYEYMPHGTLYDHIHKADTPLSWMQRLKIATGAARGLDYLHTGIGTQHGVIHRDVKSSNILLDANWEAMISDFGLSKIGPTNQSSSYVDTSVKGTFGYLDPDYFYTTKLTRKTDVFAWEAMISDFGLSKIGPTNQSSSYVDTSVKGTFGYLDPDYFYTTKLTRKTDVFAFGVVLFEILSGRLAVDRSLEEDQCSLVRWAKKCVKERKSDQLVDSSIAGTIASKCLRRFAQTAYCCLKSDPKKRLTMTEVVASLQALLELQKKFDLSRESRSIMGFPWKIHEYLFATTKLQNSDQSSINDQPKSLEMIMNQHEELSTRDVKRYTYDELKYATRDFGNDRFLGEGSYGKVYKGWINKKTYFPHKHSIGLPIAVNKLHRYRSFDLQTLKEFRHPNLVKLIGYCLKGEQLFLVYEFVPNGNFRDLLWSGAVARLPLATKVKMAVGIARGIVFLHNTQLNKGLGEEDQIVQVDMSLLERHKILLDEEFTVKLSDYDVTKLVHGCYPSHDDWYNYGECYPGYKILTGQPISTEKELRGIDCFFKKDIKKSLNDIAKLCFEICNEVNSESKMVTILEKLEV
ncbi:serine/threonine/dual specificity protein kinase, catalytic domain-containing protein [Artemisia annua]|uniref:Serine/threonine/dual specificity protein kinase, catalytic domain-containing protein n=1 Tax=Artemisia annua TaxID=35608 RepID=A0A2U1Q601_ARTAN|nr:serine/threonine/dual specificity protein kinase, catalytic domain-containing protein [Artemisia annua]